MFHPLVSIVIPVYNGANYMRMSIDSALAQTYDNIETLVVNDGSTDGGVTERIALSYGDKIRYFDKANGGVATALNMAIANMRGEYFSWLSHDDLYLPEKVEKQVKLLSELEDKTTIAFSGFMTIDGSGREIQRILPLRRYSQKQLETPLFPLFHGMIDGVNLLIHKSHFERVGLFREDLATTQDYDMWFRVMRGQCCCFVPEVLVCSRQHNAQDTITKQERVIRDGDALWIGFLNSLTDAEKIEMDGSLYKFYRNLYLRFVSSMHPKIKDYIKREAERTCGAYAAVRLDISAAASIGVKVLLSLKRYGIKGTLGRIKDRLKR
ncbi:putative glycosyltransferase [Synergistales bacterium]|nr:putative glycosyltransferase [Synergistales bacterium]